MYRQQPLRQPNHDVPHLCAGLVHSVRSSLQLGCAAEDIRYIGKRNEGRNGTVMARRNENGVSIRKIRSVEVKRDMGEGGGVEV
jgi:hypothetical protein